MACSCATCCKNFFFLIVSFIFIGAVTAVLIVAFVNFDLINKFVDGGNDKIKTYIIIGIVVCGVLLVICLVFSFINKTWAKTIVTIVLILFDLIMFALTIIFFVYGSKILDQLDDKYKENETVRNDIERTFKCSGWDDCKKKFNMNTYGGIMCGLSVVLLLLIVLSFYLSCKKSEDGDESADSQKGQFNTPLTYGW